MKLYFSNVNKDSWLISTIFLARGWSTLEMPCLPNQLDTHAHVSVPCLPHWFRYKGGRKNSIYFFFLSQKVSIHQISPLAMETLQPSSNKQYLRGILSHPSISSLPSGTWDLSQGLLNYSQFCPLLWKQITGKKAVG